MATKTVAEKMLIKPNSTVWSFDSTLLARIDPLPEGVRTAAGFGDAAVAVLFVADAAAVRDLLDTHKDRLSDPGLLWIAYPKGNTTDINRDSLWKIASPYGLVPNSQVAVDDVWSAMRFRPLKEGEAPFSGGAARGR